MKMFSAAQKCQPTPNLSPGPLYSSLRRHAEDGVICKSVKSVPDNQTIIATSIFTRTIRHGPNELILRGQVKDSKCNPVAGALVDIWQTDPSGRYSSLNLPDGNCRGYVYSKNDGSYEFRTQIPGTYGFQFGYSPIPKFDLPPWGARHIHVAIQADGYKFMTTEIQFDDDPVVGYDFRDKVAERAAALTVPGGVGQHISFDFVLERATTEVEMELSKEPIDEQMFTLFCEGQSFDVPQPHHICRPNIDAVAILAWCVLFVASASLGGFMYAVRRLLLFVAKKDNSKLNDD